VEMISILRATEEDSESIAAIGMISVEEAHRGSCSAEDLATYLSENYNQIAIKQELSDSHNIYHILSYQGNVIGFSKIILNEGHESIPQKNVTKLDRIYLLKEFQSLKLGLALLKFNIELARKNDQSGIWLYTWVGNTRAIDFYQKAGFNIIGSHYFKVTESTYNLNNHMLLSW
jgi:ribosomal protein S18 acetylase RimI-like enzyme